MANRLSEKRQNIVQELYTTERNYVQRLQQAITYFMVPLSENAESEEPFISKAQLRSIFSEITVIHSLNSLLLKELEVSANSPHSADAAIGPIFLKIGSFLRWYHSYVSNYEVAFRTLKKLKQDRPAFRTFISQTEAKPELNYTDLESLLILPIQRIPQYNLLLADLLKVTPAGHPDHKSCTAAVQLLHEIGSYINEKKREAENIHHVINIGKSLVGFPNLAVPYRRFVFEGSLINVGDFSLSSPAIKVQLFAFNDVLLLAQEIENQQYQVNHYAYYDRVGLVVDPQADVPLAFQLRLKDSSFYLITSSDEEKKGWCNRIKDHVELTRKKLAEREQLQAEKKKLLSMTKLSNPNASTVIRSLGVLAKDLADPSSPLNASSDSTSNSLETNSDASSKEAALERARSKKLRELVEAEAKILLTKEGIKDGSIDEFLKLHNVTAYYVAPLYLPSKNNSAALIAVNQCSYTVFVKLRIHYSGHLFDIKEIISKHHPDFTIKTQDGMVLECRSEFCDDIIYQLKRAYINTYPGMPESLMWTISTDPWRVPNVQVSAEKLVLGGFARTYKAACTYLNIAERADIIWDVMHNPNYQKTATKEDPYSKYELDLSKLDELYPSDFRAIMFAIRYNTYFTSLIIRDVTLVRDAVAAIADMLRYNFNICRIILSNNAIGKEQIQLLNDALNPPVNPASPAQLSGSSSNIPALAPVAPRQRNLKFLEISNNNIEDRGLTFFTKFLDQNGKFITLTNLDLSNAGLGGKGITSLFGTLRKTVSVYHSLTHLNIHSNKMDAEASAAVAAFLATPCAITNLNISNTQAKLIPIIEAITRGCIYITSLNISQNKDTKRLEPVLMKFLSKTDSLIEINLSSMGLSPEAYSQVIQAASSNVYLSQLSVKADDNNFGTAGGLAIARSLVQVAGIVEMSLCENDFGDEGLSAIFQSLSRSSTSLKKLTLDGNFKWKTSKIRSSMMRHLIAMVTAPTCSLTFLSITGGSKSTSQLKSDLIRFIDCLPQMKSISELNISGHKMGPKGIMALGRSLQTSESLKSVVWDENAATIESLDMLINAIKRNESLTCFPIPIIDLAAIIVQGDAQVNSKLQKLVSELQSMLSDNQIRIATQVASPPATPALLSPRSAAAPASTSSSTTSTSEVDTDLSGKKRKTSNPEIVRPRSATSANLKFSDISSDLSTPETVSLKLGKVKSKTTEDVTVKQRIGALVANSAKHPPSSGKIPKSARANMESVELKKKSASASSSPRNTTTPKAIQVGLDLNIKSKSKLKDIPAPRHVILPAANPVSESSSSSESSDDEIEDEIPTEIQDVVQTSVDEKPRRKSSRRALRRNDSGYKREVDELPKNPSSRHLRLPSQEVLNLPSSPKIRSRPLSPRSVEPPEVPTHLSPRSVELPEVSTHLRPLPPPSEPITETEDSIDADNEVEPRVEDLSDRETDDDSAQHLDSIKEQSDQSDGESAKENADEKSSSHYKDEDDEENAEQESPRSPKSYHEGSENRSNQSTPRNNNQSNYSIDSSMSRNDQKQVEESIFQNAEPLEDSDEEIQPASVLQSFKTRRKKLEPSPSFVQLQEAAASIPSDLNFSVELLRTGVKSDSSSLQSSTDSVESEPYETAPVLPGETVEEMEPINSSSQSTPNPDTASEEKPIETESSQEASIRSISPATEDIESPRSDKDDEPYESVPTLPGDVKVETYYESAPTLPTETKLESIEQPTFEGEGSYESVPTLPGDSKPERTEQENFEQESSRETAPTLPNDATTESPVDLDATSSNVVGITDATSPKASRTSAKPNAGQGGKSKKRRR